MKLPKSWSEVTISTYQQILDLSDSKTDELDYPIQLLSILTGESVEAIEKLTISQIRDFYAECKFINDKPTKFIDSFKIKGQRYIIDANIAHISAGQYIDLNGYIKEGVNVSLHKIMTVFCLPKDRFKKQKAYGNGYDLNETAELFRNELTIDIVMPLAAFFLTLWQQSIPVIAASLEKEVQKIQKMSEQVKKDSPRSGDGSLQSTV